MAFAVGRLPLDDDGRFFPEYAEVYGVPFSFIPASGATKEPPPRQPITHVRSLPERAAAQMTFPRLDGYRWEVPDQNLHADWTDESKMLLARPSRPHNNGGGEGLSARLKSTRWTI